MRKNTSIFPLVLILAEAVLTLAVGQQESYDRTPIRVYYSKQSMTIGSGINMFLRNKGITAVEFRNVPGISANPIEDDLSISQKYGGWLSDVVAGDSEIRGGLTNRPGVPDTLTAIFPYMANYVTDPQVAGSNDQEGISKGVDKIRKMVSILKETGFDFVFPTTMHASYSVGFWRKSEDPLDTFIIDAYNKGNADSSRRAVNVYSPSLAYFPRGLHFDHSEAAREVVRTYNIEWLRTLNSALGSILTEEDLSYYEEKTKAANEKFLQELPNIALEPALETTEIRIGDTVAIRVHFDGTPYDHPFWKIRMVGYHYHQTSRDTTLFYFTLLDSIPMTTDTTVRVVVPDSGTPFTSRSTPVSTIAPMREGGEAHPITEVAFMADYSDPFYGAPWVITSRYPIHTNDGENAATAPTANIERIPAVADRSSKTLFLSSPRLHLPVQFDLRGRMLENPPPAPCILAEKKPETMFP